MAIITRFTLLFAVLLVASSSLAQENATLRVIGSSIVNALVRQVADASGDALDIRDAGSARGIDLFCDGDYDLATSVREMTEAEAADCDANEVIYSQLLVGHQIVAFATHSDAPDACLSASSLDDLFKPTASHQLKDWSFASDEYADLPLTLILPAQEQIAYAILDELALGDGLRLDGADIPVDSVGETPGALAVAQWSPGLAEAGAVNLLSLRDAGSGECLPPSVAAVENGQYAAAQSLYMFLNRARLEAGETLLRFLEFAVEPANAGLAATAGITPPSDSVYALNADILADAEAMPLLSGDEGAFRIPPELAGEVRIVGAATAYQPLNNLRERMTRSHPQLQIDLDFAGGGAGLTDLCAAAADIAALDAQPTGDECADTEVVALPFPIGALATVLVGNAGDEFAACLTTQQITQIWRAESTEAVAQWSDVDAAFPQSPLTLFG
ncbi:MAG: substrate-binding domain-containing protein, partial [Chloroflexi bacterium]|nr:substrate-binding domain-containing protein [Chloroflexota bacterium]